jgi:2-keto-4-pentenoate hydratase/2-oxohepta-3-ene-1,7-dioic acid hydratase in catechol pathway
MEYDKDRRAFLRTTVAGGAGLAACYVSARGHDSAALAGADTAALVERPRTGKVTKYARFQTADGAAYGIVEGDRIRQLEGGLFKSPKATDKTHSLSSVKLLPPTEPTQVLALAGNYKSHLPGEEIPEKFRIPQLFFKSPSCLIANGEKIVIPAGADPVHYEAELVLVIGRLARNVTEEKAADYIFGVTSGNDVSARDWQKNDHQWWRAKGCDTFGPCGPFIVAGLNYDDLKLQLRQNGEVKQDSRTSQMIHNSAKIVSFVSQHITLHPGDLIYTGTPGKTEPMKAGDVVEIDIEGIGLLTNRVASA